MNKIPGLVLLAAAALVIPCHASNPFKQKAPPTEMERLTDEALRVNIVRDDWGIAHVEGKTDADAVFGMIFAQCEDDFNRVETNYLNAMGRLAEAEGEKRIYQDLRMKLFVDPADLQKEYAASPEWLRKLMDAFADGANFYLAKHPEVKPRVIQHFEPWMALSFTEGSIGGDIERIDLGKLEAFYGGHPAVAELPECRPRANRLQRHRHRPSEHHAKTCLAADQSAYIVLLPLRAADGQRRRARRLWSGHLGPVLCLPGIQPAGRVDAHLQRRRRRR